MVFKPTGVEPRRRRERVGQFSELASGVAGIDAIDGANGSQVAIGEVIRAPRTKAAPKR
jgi:hypothetical protein